MATVAGYRRVVMCQEARDEAEPALAPGGSVAALLLSMCERRLMPTPWLNKVPPASPTASHPVAVTAAVEPISQYQAFLALSQASCWVGPVRVRGQALTRTSLTQLH